MLDLLYSGTWADPQHDLAPTAWLGLGIDSLEARVDSCTVSVIDAGSAQGVEFDITGLSSYPSWHGTIAGLRDVVDAVSSTGQGRGKGVTWWHPEVVIVPGLDVRGGGAMARFDDSGRILPTASVFERCRA